MTHRFFQLLKFAIICVIVAAAGLIVWNAAVYFNYGGFKGGFFSNVLITVAHVVGLAACTVGIYAVWKLDIGEFDEYDR